MAKITGPFMALGASGTIASTLTASRWKGRPYLRQRVIPSNPRTTAQQLTRDIFSNLSEIWKVADALVTAPWARFVQGLVQTDRNAFMGQNVAALRGQVDLSAMIFSPGAKGGLPQSATVFTPGAGEVVVDFTTPTPPTGWTLVAAVAAAIADGAPESIVDFTTVAAEDTATMNQVTLSGLAAGDYAVGAWLEWQKPDGTTAFGPSTVSVETVT